MSITPLPGNLPTLLRAAGLTVVEVPGWQTRGRPASTGDFNPVGVLCHHTATGPDWTDARVVDLLVKGRAGLPGPLSQLGLARDGTVHVIAAGRCNHAGRARASGTVASGDGNALYIGVEAFNDGIGEPWPAAQYDAYVRLCAALCVRVTGNSVNTVRAHKETSTTGKVDPLFDMGAFRTRVAQAMRELTIPAPVPTPPLEDPDPDLDDAETIVDAFGLWKWYSGKPKGELIIEPDGKWHRLDLREPASGIKAESSEHRRLYLRVELPAGRTADRVLEAKFIRANGDATAYDADTYGLKRDSYPFSVHHMEDGDGAGGDWFVRVTGGVEPLRLTTRYAKQHTYYADPRRV